MVIHIKSSKPYHLCGVALARERRRIQILSACIIQARALMGHNLQMENRRGQKPNGREILASCLERMHHGVGAFLHLLGKSDQNF
jgi:hypothetical protein